MSHKMTACLLMSALLVLSLTACAAPSSGDPAPAAEAPVTAAPTVDPTVDPTVEPTAEPVAEPTAEAPAFDRAAYDAAVDAVLTEYAALDMSDPSGYDEASHPELPWYTAIIANTARNDLYYGFWDFDGNGVPELVIAAGDDTWQQPMGLYAFDGEKMVYLCKEQALGERASVAWTDGLFFVRASGGAATGSVTVYRIAPDGFSTELLEIMDYEYQDADTVTYTPHLGNMTPEELAGHDYMQSFSVPVEYTLFAARQAPDAIGLPNPWQEAASAEEAARGAGLDGFTPPGVLFCFPDNYQAPVLRYTQGLAEAIYDDGNNRLVVRKGLGGEDVSGDYNVYDENWEINWKGLIVQCSGSGGEITLARWYFGGNAYSLSFNSGAPGMPGLSESDLTSLVNQIQ